jgi:hypothetical protein
MAAVAFWRGGLLVRLAFKTLKAGFRSGKNKLPDTG